VTLNRPKALNSLNLEMVREMTPKYEELLKSETKMIILKGSGDKAFCAGGDIKAIYESKDPKFFAEEYQLNYLIGSLYEKHKKVQVALLNGITMGGGVGVSVQPDTLRIATEKTMFAMPETAIGFFCDVGGSYFLPRIPIKGLGMYLALTGSRLKGEQCVVAGVATHFVPSEKLGELEELLVKIARESTGPIDKEFIAKEIEKHFPQHQYIHSKHANSFMEHEKEISLFDPSQSPSVHDIVEGLKKLDTAHAHHTLKTLEQMSPTSLRVVHRQLRMGSVLGYKECFDMEYGMAKQMMNGNDFFEGVRALLVDKDKNPKWNPATLDQVKQKDVDMYFE
ncbi:enoyl-CoA hydratase family member, partial [Naegleria gruberi]